MVKIGLLSGSMIELSASQGFYFLCAGIPIGAVGIWSGIAQGKAAAAALKIFLSGSITGRKSVPLWKKVQMIRLSVMPENKKVHIL